MQTWLALEPSERQRNMANTPDIRSVPNTQHIPNQRYAKQHRKAQTSPKVHEAKPRAPLQGPRILPPVSGQMLGGVGQGPISTKLKMIHTYPSPLLRMVAKSETPPRNETMVESQRWLVFALANRNMPGLLNGGARRGFRPSTAVSFFRFTRLTKK